MKQEKQPPSGKKPVVKNRWIAHVKKVAADKTISFKKSLIKARKSYQQETNLKLQKSRHMHLKGSAPIKYTLTTSFLFADEVERPSEKRSLKSRLSDHENVKHSSVKERVSKHNK